jgi:hypothetical protein
MTKKKTGADKIIEGLKQAAQSAKCAHDWEVENATSFAGHMTIVSRCPYCGVRQTEYKTP